MSRHRSHISQQVNTVRARAQELNVFNLQRVSDEVDSRILDLLQLVQRTPWVEVSYIRLIEAFSALTRAVQRDATDPLERKVNAAFVVLLKRLDDFEAALAKAVPSQEARRRHQQDE